MSKLFPKNILSPLLASDYATIIYLTLTGILIPIFHNRIDQPLVHLFFRVTVIGLLLLFAAIQNEKNKKWLFFVRLFLPIVLLSYVYGETADFNRIIFHEPLDPYFIKADQWIFGFQPSLMFSKTFPQKWFGELMNMGYFSYYLMLLAVSLAFYLYRREKVVRVVFILLTSFYIYYIIFIIFPVFGPQYYFKPPENEALHTGLFSWLVQTVQKNGEHPTGAFPSSHVGMAIIYLLLAYRDFKKLFFLLIPFTILILFATVYIKAHYAIDVIGGLLSAPIIYQMSRYLFKKCDENKINRLPTNL